MKQKSWTYSVRICADMLYVTCFQTSSVHIRNPSVTEIHFYRTSYGDNVPSELIVINEYAC